MPGVSGVNPYIAWMAKNFPEMKYAGLAFGLPRSFQKVIRAAIRAEQRALDEGRDADIPAIHAAARAALPESAWREGERALRSKARASAAKPQKPHLQVVRPSAAVSALATSTISARPVVTASVQERPTMKTSMSFSAFLKNVRNAMTKAGPVDPVFANSQSIPGTNTSQEGTGGDGGYLVPDDARTEIASAILSETSLLGFASRFFTRSFSVTLPANIGPYWSTTPVPDVDRETDKLKVAKGALAGREFRLGKLDVLIPATDELVEDTGEALNVWLSKVVADRFVFRINDQFLNGSGQNGMPLGFLQSPALITQAAESGQTAGTIVWANIAKMWARVPSQNRARVAWVAHPDAETQLLLMVAPANAFGVPTLTYDEAGVLRLLGRPVVFCEAAQAVGTPGDLVLADMGSVIAGVRETTDGSGIRKDFSISCFFDYGVSAFRFSIRFGAVNLWAAPVNRLRGGNTVSSVVALAAR